MVSKTKRDGGGADVIIVRPCRIQQAAMGFGRSWAGRLERCWICVCDAEVYILDENPRRRWQTCIVPRETELETFSFLFLHWLVEPKFLT